MKLMTLLTPVFLVLLLFFSGCGSHDVSDYKDRKPALDLFRFFDGKSWGRGMVFDRSGKLTRQFIVAIEGTVERGNKLTLHESFSWSDGERSTRTWTINREPEGGLNGTAADIRGEARGRGAGNSFNWKYTLALDVDGSTWNINFNDWMFLQEGNFLFNRAYMSKFGFRVGEVFIVFSKDPGFAGTEGL